MSIIIGLITKTNHLYIGADKRAKLIDGTINDNYEKIYFLRPDLYFGMTGSAEYGLYILNKIKEFQDFSKLSIKELIEKADDLYKPIELGSTILIAGRLENNQVFFWIKNTDGQTDLKLYDGQNIYYSINTNRQIGDFEKKLVDEIRRSNIDAQNSIKKTIEYASTIDDSISYDCKIIKI